MSSVTAGGQMSVEPAVQVGMQHIVVLLVGFASHCRSLPLIQIAVIVVCGQDGEEISVVTVAYIVRQWR